MFVRMWVDPCERMRAGVRVCVGGCVLHPIYILSIGIYTVRIMLPIV